MSVLRSFSVLPARSTVAALCGLALGLFILTGCDSTGPSTDGSEVSVGFSTSSSSPTSSAFTKTAHDSLSLTGTNGTLTIDSIRVIVSEVELEGDADSAEFESERPSFVPIPLNSSDVVSVVSDRVPPGTYTQFGFEVEDLEVDDADDDDSELKAVRDDIEAAGFSNWPDGASMVVIGSFAPADGSEVRDFTTYFDAEIEVEVEMESRPFEIGGDGSGRQLTVNLNPAGWFQSSDTVQDLSQDDYQNTEELAELEVEFENGIDGVDFDDDDDDDDSDD